MQYNYKEFRERIAKSFVALSIVGLPLYISSCGDGKDDTDGNNDQTTPTTPDDEKDHNVEEQTPNPHQQAPPPNDSNPHQQAPPSHEPPPEDPNKGKDAELTKALEKLKKLELKELKRKYNFDISAILKKEANTSPQSQAQKVWAELLKVLPNLTEDDKKLGTNAVIPDSGAKFTTDMMGKLETLLVKEDKNVPKPKVFTIAEHGKIEVVGGDSNGNLKPDGTLYRLATEIKSEYAIKVGGKQIKVQNDVAGKYNKTTGKLELVLNKDNTTDKTNYCKIIVQVTNPTNEKVVTDVKGTFRKSDGVLALDFILDKELIGKVEYAIELDDTEPGDTAFTKKDQTLKVVKNTYKLERIDENYSATKATANGFKGQKIPENDPKILYGYAPVYAALKYQLKRNDQVINISPPSGLPLSFTDITSQREATEEKSFDLINQEYGKLNIKLKTVGNVTAPTSCTATIEKNGTIVIALTNTPNNRKFNVEITHSDTGKDTPGKTIERKITIKDY